MNEPNKKTLETYQNHFDNYIAGTPGVTEEHESQGVWIKEVLQYAQVADPVLEIGSAFGRDAAYMRALGYDPQVTDAFDAAVDYLRDHGFNATKLNVLTDEIEGKYKVIIACAVFLHFTESELRSVLTKLVDHIAAGGVLGFTLKNGEGEEWSDEKMDAPRYFHYWNVQTLQPILEDCGYGVISIRVVEGDKWLQVIVRPRD